MYQEVLWGRCRTLGRTHLSTLDMRYDYEDICKRRGTWEQRQGEVDKLLAGQIPLGLSWPPENQSKNPEEEILLEEAF